MDMHLTLKDNMSHEEALNLMNLGYLLENGIVFERDYTAAAKCYQYAVDNNIPRAMNNLGCMYLNGQGVEKDVKSATELFKLSIQYKETLAMINLGNIYEFGLLNGVPDYAMACKYYKMAADLGDTKGLFNYANCLHYGYGVKKNRKKALSILSSLAEQHYDGAAFYVGLYYENGFVVAKDIGCARKYYRQGALEGDAYCFTELGRMYAKGIGVKQDVNAALDYYEEAANRGDALGFTNMAWLYENGDFGEPDLDKAIELYTRAADLNEIHAIEALTRLGILSTAKENSK